MNFYCPTCMNKHEDGCIRFGVDPNNKLLQETAVNEIERLIAEHEMSLKHEADSSEKNNLDMFAALLRSENGPAQLVRRLFAVMGSGENKGYSILCFNAVKAGPQIFRVSLKDIGDGLKIAYKYFCDIIEARSGSDDVWLASPDEIASMRDLFKKNGLIDWVFSSDEVVSTFDLQVDMRPEENNDKSSQKQIPCYVFCTNKPQLSILKICSECRNAIFPEAGRVREIVIGLLGSERVAKTAMIVACINVFLEDMKTTDVHFVKAPNNPLWDKTVAPMLKDYKDGWAPKKTDTKIAGDKLSATVKAIIPGGYGRPEQTLIVTFADMPGEYIHREDGGIDNRWVADCLRFYSNADVLWYCMDLVQAGQCADRDFQNASGYNLKEDDPTGKHLLSPRELSENLEQIKSLLVQVGNRAEGFPPVAIILTKSDMAPDFVHVNPDFQPVEDFIFSESLCGRVYNNEIYLAFTEQQAGCMLEQGFMEYSMSVKQKLSNLNGEMISTLDKYFIRNAYFSSSASGYKTEQRPESDQEDKKLKAKDEVGNFMAIRQFKAYYPMLWTLAVLGELAVEITVNKFKIRRGVPLDKGKKTLRVLPGHETTYERNTLSNLCGKSILHEEQV